MSGIRLSTAARVRQDIGCPDDEDLLLTGLPLAACTFSQRHLLRFGSRSGTYRFSAGLRRHSLTIMAVVAAGMAAAVIGMVGARIALLAAGMGVVVTGTAVAGMAVVAAGIMVVMVAAGELAPQWVSVLALDYSAGR